MLCQGMALLHHCPYDTLVPTPPQPEPARHVQPFASKIIKHKRLLPGKVLCCTRTHCQHA